MKYIGDISSLTESRSSVYMNLDQFGFCYCSYHDFYPIIVIVDTVDLCLQGFLMRQSGWVRYLISI